LALWGVVDRFALVRVKAFTARRLRGIARVWALAQ
jgi:hypothetical protein